MALFLDESFEGAGYENSWSETRGSTNYTCDEDASIPGTAPTGAGSQCLHTEISTTVADSYTVFDYGSGQNTSNYVRFYFYIHSDTEEVDTSILEIFKLEGAVANLKVNYRYTASKGHHVAYGYYDNGNQSGGETTGLNTNQWYRVEAKYDSSASAYEFRIDGVSVSTGSIGVARTDSRYFQVGQEGDRGGDVTEIYFELCKWGDTGWFGAEPSSSTGAAPVMAPYNIYQQLLARRIA